MIGCIGGNNWGGLATTCGLVLPEGGDVLAPWVEVEFGTSGIGGPICESFVGSGSTITVSNLSSPSTDPENVAIISAFEFGSGAGFTVKVTIQDQQGGSFVRFVEHLFKEWACHENGLPPAATMKFRFGWCNSSCKFHPATTSPVYFGLMDAIETSFREGKFVAEITGKDSAWRMLEGGSEKHYGGEGDQGMCLVDAINELLVNSEAPNVGSVAFRKLVNGQPVPVGFEIKDPTCGKVETLGDDGLPTSTNKGPRGKWICNAQDKLRVALRWLEGFRSENKKGWIPTYNSKACKGEVIFWEDRKPHCKPQPDDYWDAACQGIYVVNGSKDSPVLEFNPKVRWDFSRLSSVGGQVSSESSSPHVADEGGGTRGTKSPGRRDCSTQKRASMMGAGHPKSTPASPVHKELFGKEATSKNDLGQVASMEALQITGNPVEADLVVVGDPTLDPVFTIHNKNVTIIFINPFHLMTGKGCTDWTATPVCNEVLSSKSWIIKEINHSILAGRYTTTMKVFLVAPGVDGEVGVPMGLWTGGWTPRSCF